MHFLLHWMASCRLMHLPMHDMFFIILVYVLRMFACLQNQVLTCIRAWEECAVYPPMFLANLRVIFLGQEEHSATEPVSIPWTDWTVYSESNPHLMISLAFWFVSIWLWGHQQAVVLAWCVGCDVRICVPSPYLSSLWFCVARLLTLMVLLLIWMVHQSCSHRSMT